MFMNLVALIFHLASLGGNEFKTEHPVYKLAQGREVYSYCLFIHSFIFLRKTLRMLVSSTWSLKISYKYL